MKTFTKIGQVSNINLVDDTTKMMISQFGKFIRIDMKSGRSASGVRLLNLDTDDMVASATIIPQLITPTARSCNNHHRLDCCFCFSCCHFIL